MIQRTKELIDNYKNLNYEDVFELIGLIVKEEKEKLGLSLPIKLELLESEDMKFAGGDTSIIRDSETKKAMYQIRMNPNDGINNFLNNKSKISDYKNGLSYDNGMDALFKIIAQVSHEMRHAYQYECTFVKKDIQSENSLLWLKEQLAMPEEVYKENYDNSLLEQDAFHYMYEEALNYINEYTNIKISNPLFYKQLQEQMEKQQIEIKSVDETYCNYKGKKLKMSDALNLMFEQKAEQIPEQTFINSILRYEYNSDGTKKSYDELLKDKQNLLSNIDINSPEYKEKSTKINEIYENIIKNDENLIQKSEKNQSGYTIEEKENNITEKQQQILMDYSANEIGTRIISDAYDIKTGKRKVETISQIENEDGNFVIKVEETENEKRKELNREYEDRKEKLLYQKEKGGKETYSSIVNGTISYKITKNERGTTIDKYDVNGQLTDTFEYDENGKALIGIEGLENIDEKYVENFFDSQIPYFEAENRDISEETIISTEKLAKETLENQKNVNKVDSVENYINEQRDEQVVKVENRDVRNTENDKKTFKEELKFHFNSEQYADVLAKQYEEDLKNGNIKENKTENKYNHKVEKGDNDHIM